MDSCAICLGEIDVATTGCTTTSCQHTFHFFCLSSWFIATRDPSSCPCCRKLMGPMEDVPLADEDDEDEDAEDDEDDEEDAPSFFFYGELNRLIRSRGGQSISMAQWMRMPLDEGQVCFSSLQELNNLLVGKDAAPLTNDEWCDIPCNNFVEDALPYGETSAVHLMEDGGWAEQAMNPEDRTGIAVYLTKDDVGAASIMANLLAKKIQKKWRSTKQPMQLEQEQQEPPITLQQLEDELMAAH